MRLSADPISNTQQQESYFEVEARHHMTLFGVGVLTYEVFGVHVGSCFGEATCIADVSCANPFCGFNIFSNAWASKLRTNLLGFSDTVMENDCSKTLPQKESYRGDTESVLRHSHHRE